MLTRPSWQPTAPSHDLGTEVIINHEWGPDAYAGYGDLCVAAFISEGSKSGPVTVGHYVHPGPRRKFLESFGQHVADSPDRSVKLYELVSPDESGGRLTAWNRALGLNSTPIRPAYAPSSERLTSWATGIADSFRKKFCSHFVLLCPQVAGAARVAREWPAHHWNDLPDQLQRYQIGAATLIHHRDERYERTGKVVHSVDWDHFAALMRQADLIIALESGAGMFAGTIGCKTLSLMGGGRPSIFEHLPEVTVMQATHQQISCVRCGHSDKLGYRRICDFGCQAMSLLTAEAVARRAAELLGIAIAAGKGNQTT